MGIKLFGLVDIFNRLKQEKVKATLPALYLHIRTNQIPRSAIINNDIYVFTESDYQAIKRFYKDKMPTKTSSTIEVYGLVDVVKKINEAGYDVAKRTLHYHVNTGRLTYSALINGKIFVFTKDDVNKLLKYYAELRKKKKHGNYKRGKI